LKIVQTKNINLTFSVPKLCPLIWNSSLCPLYTPPSIISLTGRCQKYKVHVIIPVTLALSVPTSQHSQVTQLSTPEILL
jgi:hypothetical protein